MAIRKKITQESETVKSEGAVNSDRKSTRVRGSAATEATGPENRTAKTQAPSAATHKAPARKTVTTTPAAEVLVETVVVERAAFDAGLHHEEINKEAYYNWLRGGCRQDSEHHDWLAAVETVRARYEK